VTWAANRGQAQWGDVKLALADPATETAGLLGLTAATAGFTGSTALDPGDLLQADAYQRWLAGVARARRSPPPGAAQVLAQGPAVADIYIGLQAELDTVLSTAARRSDFEVVNLSPVFDIDAVLVSSTIAPRGAPDGLGDALRATGWAAQLSGGQSLPPAATLAGMRRVWIEASR
jgi:hypothetical protein